MITTVVDIQLLCVRACVLEVLRTLYAVEEKQGYKQTQL